VSCQQTESRPLVTVSINPSTAPLSDVERTPRQAPVALAATDQAQDTDSGDQYTEERPLSPYPDSHVEASIVDEEELAPVEDPEASAHGSMDNEDRNTVQDSQSSSGGAKTTTTLSGISSYNGTLKASLCTDSTCPSINSRPGPHIPSIMSKDSFFKSPVPDCKTAPVVHAASAWQRVHQYLLDAIMVMLTSLLCKSLSDYSASGDMDEV